MGMHQRSKKATNLTLDAEMVNEAKKLGVNISQAAEEGIRDALRKAWSEANRDSMDAWGKWAEENGLPLEKSRMF